MSKGSTARAVLVGRMGSTVEIKTIGNGTRVGNLSLACTSGYGDKQETSWFRVQVFGDKKIDVLRDYTEKGSRLFVEGELRIRKYQHQGVDKFATEVIVGFDGVMEILDGVKETNGGVSGSQRQETRARQPDPAYDDDLDDDVPF